MTTDAEIILALDVSDGHEPPLEITLEQFRADNASDAEYFDGEHLAPLRLLAVGAKYEANEGAAGTWSATRLR